MVEIIKLVVVIRGLCTILLSILEESESFIMSAQWEREEVINAQCPACK